MTHPYELVLILRPEGTEEQLKTVLSRSEELIKKEGGQVVATEVWGRRRLAFPIKKQREGVYYLLRVALEASTVGRIKQALQLEEAIVRAMLLRSDDEAAAQPMRIPAMATPGARDEWR